MVADQQPRSKPVLERTRGKYVRKQLITLLSAVMCQVAGDDDPVGIHVMGLDIGQACLEIGDRVMAENGRRIEVYVGDMHKFHVKSLSTGPWPIRQRYSHTASLA
jgi:hypothetical protein